MGDRPAAVLIAEALAPLLPGWTLGESPHEHLAYLVRADGAKIGVMVGSWSAKGRVTIAGMWPRYADGSTYWPKCGRVEITCAVTRAPKDIAREIQRRLLPGYDHEYAIARAAVDEHNENVEDASAVARRIASVVGGHVGKDATRRGDGVHIYGEPGAVYRLRVDPARSSRGVSVSFEVHDLDPETAAEVLAIIRAAEERKRGRDLAGVAPRFVIPTPELAEHEGDLEADVEAGTVRRRRIG